MRRSVTGTFLLTLVIVYLRLESAAQSLEIKAPKVGDLSIVVTPIAPGSGGSASVDVFAACTSARSTSPSLLNSHSQNGVYGPGTISLILADPLTAGQTLCVMETISDGGSTKYYSTNATVPAAVPVAQAAPTKLEVKPVAAGQTSVTIITAPFVDGDTGTVDLYSSCADADSKPTSSAAGSKPPSSLVAPGSATRIGKTSDLFQLQLKEPLKEGDIICAVETLSGKATVIKSFPVVASASKPIPPPTSPIISGALNDRSIRFRVNGQPNDSNYTSSTLYVCVWPASSAKPSTSTPPATDTTSSPSTTGADSTTPSTNGTSSTGTANNALDCTTIGSKVQPTAVRNHKLDAVRLSFIQAEKSGQTDITLPSPLSAGETVSIVQVSTPASGKAQTVLSPQPYPVGTTEQCNKEPIDKPYSDCDLSFSIIGGVEQAALSSQPSQTDGFLRIFTRAGINSDNPLLNSSKPWGEIRLLSAPQQSSSSGVVAAFTNPSGQITTTSISSVGNSIDFSLGWEEIFPHKGKYSISIIEGGGGTTTLSSNSLTEAFTAPPLGTVECSTLYNRFATFFKANQILLNSPTNNMGSTAGACLLNGNDPSSNGSGSTVYAPINTIGFSNQDRSDFLAKYFIGLRSIYRYKAPKASACGDTDAVNHIAPCSRGIVDFTAGQDESVTGGYLHGMVVKVEGVYPLLIKGNAFLYLFGSFSMRTLKNQNDSPLILQPASLSGLTGTGSTAVPNVNTVVLPLQQPNRDFYRFGIGLDAVCIFTKIFSSGTSCPATGSTSQ